MNENNPSSIPIPQSPSQQLFPPKKSHRWAIYWAISVGLCMAVLCCWLHFSIGNPIRIQMGLAVMNLSGFALAVGAFWKSFSKD
jgi:hypothetical protein